MDSDTPPPRALATAPKRLASLQHSPHFPDFLSTVFRRRKRRVFVEQKRGTIIFGLSGKFALLLAAAMIASIALVTITALWQMRVFWYEETAERLEKALNDDSFSNESLSRTLGVLAYKVAPYQRGMSRREFIDLRSQYSSAFIVDLSSAWRRWAVYRIAVLWATTPQTILLETRFGREGKEKRLAVVVPNRSFFAYERVFLVVGCLAVLVASLTLLLWFREALVRPLEATAQAMNRFTMEPDNLMRMLIAPDRADEIGYLQRELTRLQVMYRITMKQYQHLAALGGAVTKVNHDLKGLLSTVLLAGESLSESDDVRVRNKVGRFITAIERAITLCKKILGYVGQDRRPLYLERLDPSELIAGLTEDLNLGGGETKVSHRIHSSLPIQGNREDLYRAFRNISQNAIESGASHVVLSLRADASHVHASFVDDGPGIFERVRETLFQPFGVSTKQGGSGLGLSIAHEIIKQHGGSLSLVSTSAKGSNFYCVLPVAIGADIKQKPNKKFAQKT